MVRGVADARGLPPCPRNPAGEAGGPVCARWPAPRQRNTLVHADPRCGRPGRVVDDSCARSGSFAEPTGRAVRDLTFRGNSDARAWRPLSGTADASGVAPRLTVSCPFTVGKTSVMGCALGGGLPFSHSRPLQSHGPRKPGEPSEWSDACVGRPVRGQHAAKRHGCFRSEDQRFSTVARCA